MQILLQTNVKNIQYPVLGFELSNSCTLVFSQNYVLEQGFRAAIECLLPLDALNLVPSSDCICYFCRPVVDVINFFLEEI